MYLFIQKGVRGGNSYIAKRYSKAYNKYVPDYDINEESKCIDYLDAKNLHGLRISIYSLWWI